MLIPRHSEFRGRANSEAKNGKEFHEKKVLLNSQNKNGGISLIFFYSCNFIQHCSSAAHQIPLCQRMLGSNPGQLWLRPWMSVRRSSRSVTSHPLLCHISSTLGYISSTLDYISSTTWLHLVTTWLHLFHYSATSHPLLGYISSTLGYISSTLG